MAPTNRTTNTSLPGAKARADREDGAIRDLFPEVKPHNGNDDDNYRFTIPRALSWLRSVGGVNCYDLDAAACEESHHADNWYGWKPDGGTPGGLFLHDGLTLPWFGDVFCNPPWDDLYPWVLRAWKAFREPRQHGFPSLISVSMILPANRTHRPWWQELVEPFRDGRGCRFWEDETRPALSVHFASERFPYGAPGNPTGKGVVEPNFTSVGLIWRAA